MADPDAWAFDLIDPFPSDEKCSIYPIANFVKGGRRQVEGIFLLH
jgi:hypothetical protein